MKKFFTALLMLAVMLTSTVAMAAYKETVTEDADLGAIKRLAVALPYHYKVEDEEPTVEEFAQIIASAGQIARFYVISYDEIAANIQRDTEIDIKSLQGAELRTTYSENISNYADAFLIVTTANNSSKTQFFFDVFDAKSGEMIYRLTSQSSAIGKNSKDYAKACEDFYKKFDAATEKSIKNAKKKSK